MTLILIILILLQAVTMILLHALYLALRDAEDVNDELIRNELSQCKKIRELYIALKAEKEVTNELENKIFKLIWEREQNYGEDETA